MESEKDFRGRIFKLTNKYIMRKVAGESVLMTIDDSAKVFGDMGNPNETFVFLWEQFQNPVSVQDVIDVACKEYSGNSEEIALEVLRFVEDSLQVGALEEIN